MNWKLKTQQNHMIRKIIYSLHLQIRILAISKLSFCYVKISKTILKSAFLLIMMGVKKFGKSPKNYKII